MVYRERVAPALAEYMGFHIFEDICAQWLRRYARERLNLTIRNMGRYWSRNGRIEIDIVAELDSGTFVFCECKWRTDGLVRLSDDCTLQAKVSILPEANWRIQPSYLLFTVRGFAPEFQELANDVTNRLFLVSGHDLFLNQPISVV